MSEENTMDNGGEQTVSPEVVREAELLGWVPKDQFRGNEDDWIDADVFVKRGKEINPILRKNNETLLKKLNAKDAEIAEIKAAVEEFRKYHEETEARAYKRALDDLKAAKKQALEEGDHEAVVDIDEEIADLKEAKKTTPSSPEPEVPSYKTDPIYIGWEADNQWIVGDTAMQRAAEQAAELMRIRGNTSVGRDFLDQVTEKIKEAFPEKFSNTRRNQASPVEGGGNGSTRTGKKTYADLPAEAKKACDRFVAQKLMTREQYLADYDWE